VHGQDEQAADEDGSSAHWRRPNGPTSIMAPADAEVGAMAGAPRFPAGDGVHSRERCVVGTRLGSGGARQWGAFLAAGHPSDETAAELASEMLALAHPIRVKIIWLVMNNPAGEECGRVLARTLRLPETTVSHHLRLLRQAGFIESHRHGMSMYHRPHPKILGALWEGPD
jgi:ArsR family transcriptional regulator